MDITVKPFGATPDGEKVDLYTLTNRDITASIITYGGIVTSLQVPDRHGKMEDVVLGFDNLDDYIKHNPYFGAIVGRYGNRIGKGFFVLDGKEYHLATNNGENHLHGGLKGFDKKVWQAEPIKTDRDVRLKLTYTSKDGEEGYPGNLKCTVTYILSAHRELIIQYEATTDQATPINLTNHSYFNLSACRRDILEHEMFINADRFTPVDSGLIPIGELWPVKDTPLDFLMPTAIGARINSDYEQIKLGGGYDHNFVLNKDANKLSLAARVYEPLTGRVMEVFTTEPGVQFYTGNFLDGSLTGKQGVVYKHRFAFCLETQHYPDSPNKPNFPSTILRPGETYNTQTIFKFSAR